MARARRTMDRRTLRDQNEAAERKKGDEEKDELEEETDDEEESDEEESEEEAAGGDDEDAGDGDDDEDKPKKKKKVAAKKKVVAKKVPKVKAPTKPRTRAAKIVRMKVVWAVYSNSHALLQEFAYPQKADAEAYLEKVTTDKKSGGPFFMQPLKKPMEKE